MALGLVSAIAFSASYQLVARFANKNVVSLGLGCVGSGLVVLALEMAVHMRSHPTHRQLVILFELTAGQPMLLVKITASCPTLSCTDKDPSFVPIARQATHSVTLMTVRRSVSMPWLRVLGMSGPRFRSQARPCM